MLNIKIYLTKMGNKGSTYSILDMKPASLYQLEDPILDLEKHIASGDSIETALNNLEEICIKYGIPCPEKFDNIYHCGTINIVNSIRIEKRLNPVFFKQRKCRVFAILYYPKI